MRAEAFICDSCGVAEVETELPKGWEDLDGKHLCPDCLSMSNKIDIFLEGVKGHLMDRAVEGNYHKSPFGLSDMFDQLWRNDEWHIATLWSEA